jgi:VWFA-related protein
MPRRVIAFGALLVILFFAAHEAAVARVPQQQNQGAFRSSVILVPLDVRVVDKTGKPVTDLKQEDFTVQEDGVRQQIGHFEKREMTPEAPQADAKWATTRSAAFSMTTQNDRIFLILLGRGKLQEPSKALDALLNFVRVRLMPQDRVALFTYDRATPFTTDHETIAKIIERFKKLHPDIDMEVNLQLNGLAQVYGSKVVPKTVQSKINMLFEGLMATTDLGRANGKTAAMEADARRQTDALINKTIEDTSKVLDDPTLGLPGMSRWTSHDEIETQAFTDLPLDEFIDRNGQSLQDLGNLYAAIEYMRHFEGEKHILYLTEKGLNLPRWEDDQRLWKAANDARVVIDAFQTGGIYIGQQGGQPVSAWSETFANQTTRSIAEQTGGIAGIMESGQWMMDRVDQATRVGYLLGYYPTNASWDGSYRKITVKVNRPDVQVLSRSGYYGRREVGAFDRRTFITTDRIMGALNYASGGRQINDLKLKLKASKTTSGGMAEITVDVTIDATRVSMTTVNGVHIGSLDIAVFAGDLNGNVVGNSLQKAELKLAEEQFQAIKKNGIPYQLRLRVPAGVRRIKVVVYDYVADLVGTAEADVM